MEKRKMGRISGILSVFGLLITLSSVFLGSEYNDALGEGGKMTVAQAGLVVVGIGILLNYILKI
jgi:hypothetical protein